MATLFASAPGSVVALADTGAQCMTTFLSLDPGIVFQQQYSIVTRMTLSHQANVQFLHSLGSLIYVYVFGDRMGQFTLSGLSFRCICPGLGGEHGASKMLTWYKTNRVSKRQRPVTITIGSQVLEGFVVGFTEDVVDPSTELVQWNATMSTLPDDDGGGGGGGGGGSPPPSVGTGALGNNSGFDPFIGNPSPSNPSGPQLF